MPPSEAKRSREHPERGLAILAESLFLLNLLLLPGLAFLVLAWLYVKRRNTAQALAKNHLRQTFTTSLWAGALLVIASLLIIVLGGFQNPATWAIVLVYFIVCHASLVLLGMLGLSKAMAGQMWRFPIVGPRYE